MSFIKKARVGNRRLLLALTAECCSNVKTEAECCCEGCGRRTSARSCICSTWHPFSSASRINILKGLNVRNSKLFVWRTHCVEHYLIAFIVSDIRPFQRCLFKGTVLLRLFVFFYGGKVHYLLQAQFQQ